MGITDSIRDEVMAQSEAYRAEAPDGYDFWQEHVQFVVARARSLAEKHGADAELVELAALLHDIALMAGVGTRQDHHINGASMAEALLAKHHYPPERIARVKKSVLHHRSSRNGTDTEDICVADADILAQFDNISMMFATVLGQVDIHSTPLPRLRAMMQAALESEYNDLSTQTRQDFAEQYRLICRVVLGAHP